VKPPREHISSKQELMLQILQKHPATLWHGATIAAVSHAIFVVSVACSGTTSFADVFVAADYSTVPKPARARI